MERVGVLINKLQEQLLQKADVQNMLITTQLLHNELLYHVKSTTVVAERKVAVVVPNAVVVPFEQVEDVKSDPAHEAYKPVLKPEVEPEPVVEPISEPEATTPEAVPLPVTKPEAEPIPHFIEQKPWHNLYPVKEEKAGAWALDPLSEVPTLAHQEKVVYELNDTIISEAPKSINDKLKESNGEMGALLKEAPIRDLKKAISINDRHRFIHELFRDDETMYERSIKTINGFHIFAEAEYWIQRELKVKLGWDTTLELVKTFDQLVKRRFS
jgi:hypothetical protein